jgi:hypothetical protein
MSQPISTVHVVLGLPVRNKDTIAFAKNVQSSLTNNPRFPSPNIVLATFAADIAAFDQAETQASAKVPGAATQRNAKKTKVLQDLRHLRDYVQQVAETLTTDALTAVESSGFRVKKQSSQHKQALAVKDGPASGSVELVAKAVARTATYYWQYSLDGKTWTSCPDTMKATALVNGLTVGQIYSFRFRALTRGGATDFSQIVTHVVK